MICSVLYRHKGRVKDVINGELELQDDISKLTDVLKKLSTQQYDIDQMLQKNKKECLGYPAPGSRP